MGPDESIAALRSRVSALVEQESVLLTQAFELSRGGGDPRTVDGLFARVQAIQVERNSLRKQIGNILGSHRLQSASEVWKVGVYDYRQEAGGDSVRVRVTKGPLGLQVLFPDQRRAVSIDTVEGNFDGPLAVDDTEAHREAGDLQTGALANASGVTSADEAKPRRRPAVKKNPA